MLQLTCSIPQTEYYKTFIKLMEEWKKEIVRRCLPKPTFEELEDVEEKGRVGLVLAYRERTGLGLVDAKFVIDFHLIAHGRLPWILCLAKPHGEFCDIHGEDEPCWKCEELNGFRSRIYDKDTPTKEGE